MDKYGMPLNLMIFTTLLIATGAGLFITLVWSQDWEWGKKEMAPDTDKIYDGIKELNMRMATGQTMYEAMQATIFEDFTDEEKAATIGITDMKEYARALDDIKLKHDIERGES